MKLTRKEGQSLVYENLEGWSKVSESLDDTTRWSNQYSGIFKHKETGKFYETYWSVGATEYQEEFPFDGHDPELVEVHEVEKLVKVWEPV